MSEETDAPQGGADGVESSVVDNAAPAANAEDTAAQPTGAEEAGQAEEPGAPPKRTPWWEKRFDELTADKYAERRRADRLEQELNALRHQPAPQPEAAKLPTLEEFDYDEAKYAAALAKHFSEAAEKVVDEKLTRRQRETAEEAKNESAIAKLREGGAKHPDFVAAVSGIPATEAVRDFILAADNAADVLYELGKDTTASEHFNKLSPYQQAIELGKRAATPKATTRTIPPPPPQTVAGLASGIGKTPDEMSMAEYAAWVKERDKS